MSFNHSLNAVEHRHFKHMKLVLANAFAKVYTMRLEEFSVHAIFFHGKSLCLVGSIVLRVKQPTTIKARDEL